MGSSGLTWFAARMAGPCAGIRSTPSIRSLCEARNSGATVARPNRHQGSSATLSGRSLTSGSYILPSVDARGVAEAMRGRIDEFVEALRELVDIDSGTFTRDGVNRVADLCEARFQAEGWGVERIA